MADRDIILLLAHTEERHNPGAWPSGKATDFEYSPQGDDEGGSDVMRYAPEVVNTVSWAFAPDWLTVEEAQALTGHDRGYLHTVIEAGGVDLDAAGLIEKRSLYEWQRTVAALARFEVDDKGGAR